MIYTHGVMTILTVLVDIDSEFILGLLIPKTHTARAERAILKFSGFN